MHKLVTAAVASTCLLAPAFATPQPASATTLPTASTFAGRSNVGPLFSHGIRGNHMCVGTVITSGTRNLVVTAAHCVSGHGTQFTFAPGYRAGRTPHGVWRVQAAYVDDAWRLRRDPRHDIALLVMAPQNGHRIQDVTGSSPLGIAQPRGTLTSVPAYRTGHNDLAIHCTNRIGYTAGYPSFTCRGYTGGVSGAPFLVGSYVTGVIGGLHHGGCTPAVSYTSPFTTSMINGLYSRAIHRSAQAWIPSAGGDGC